MILERSGGYGVRVHAGFGRQVWVGTFPTREEAEHAEDEARQSGRLEEVRRAAQLRRAEQVSQTEKAARMRAVKMFPAEPCEICGDPDIDRHHRDGVPTNNVRDNIVFLCHRHHRCAHAKGGRALLAEALKYAEQAESINEVRRIVSAARRATEKLHRRVWK